MASGTRPTLVFVLGLAPTKIGGIEKFLRLFVLELDRRGWNTVLCFDGPVADVFRASVDFPCCTLADVPGQENLGFAAASSLWRVLRQHRAKRFLYAFHGVMRCFPWMARAAGARFVSFYDHSSRPPGFRAGPLSTPKRVVGRVLTAPLDLIVSVAEFTRATGTSLGLSSATNVVLSNGVDLPEPSPERGRALRERLGIAPDAVVILQLCWMVPVKGVTTLLKAVPEVLRAMPAAHFLLVGDGPDLPHYRSLAAAAGAADRVTFTGVISDPTANGVFEAADIYCQPSLWQEACPLAVLEAMSFGLPVVASRIGGMPELVRDGSTGLLFTPDDAAELAGHLLALAADGERRMAMGRAAAAEVAAHHQLQTVVERYVALVLQSNA